LKWLFQDFYTNGVKMVGPEELCLSSMKSTPASWEERVSKLLRPVSVDVLGAQKANPNSQTMISLKLSVKNPLASALYA